MSSAATNISEVPAVAGDLIDRFRQGDRDAFTAIYREHHQFLFRFALLMTADRVKAADIVQDVFVWLIHHPREFDPRRGELGPFLAGVARKMLQRRDRADRRWLPFGGAEPAQQEDLDRALDSDALKRAIAVLPIRYREAVVLCDLESKSYDEAAALLGCAVGTVRSRLHRGRELLARKFQPKEFRK